MPDHRDSITNSLNSFAGQPLRASASAFFRTLGYQSDRTADWSIKTFLELAAQSRRQLTGEDIQSLHKLTSFHLLFQLTDAEVSDVLSGQQSFPDSVKETEMESYLFFAVELPAGPYTRTELSTVVRAINKPLPMPALVLLKHGEILSLGIIHRRLNKRDRSKDVLEKVTLIKDINLTDPIRAHIEILHDGIHPLRKALDKLQTLDTVRIIEGKS